MPKRSLDELDWKPKPIGTFIAVELIRSDAWRSLSSTEKDIWMFVLTCRRWPKSRKKNYNYWKPNNRDHLKVPTIAIQDCLRGTDWGMVTKEPHQDTIRRAFQKFMTVGLLSLKHQGGSGKGDQNIYKLEEHWRVWRKGDPPCFKKESMTQGKGFCQPGSNEFFSTP